MRIRSHAMAAVLALIVVVPAAWANVGPLPWERPALPTIKEDLGKVLSRHKASYETVFDAKAKRARLVIPRKLLTGGAAEDAAPKTSGLGGHGLMAALALSLGVVSGGLWWARRGTGGGRHRTLLIVTAAAGVLTLAASVLWADIAVPKRKGPAPQPELLVTRVGNLDVDVEVTENGSKVYLVMPAPNPGNPFGNPAPAPKQGPGQEE